MKPLAGSLRNLYYSYKVINFMFAINYFLFKFAITVWAYLGNILISESDMCSFNETVSNKLLGIFKTTFEHVSST